MPPQISQCGHVDCVGQNTWDIINNKRSTCNTCEVCQSPGPNLWLCLYSRCLFVGCGESAADHSTEHASDDKHPLTMNLTTLRIWCYDCECEVYKDGNTPPLVVKGLTNRPKVSAEQHKTSVQHSPTQERYHDHAYTNLSTHSGAEESEEDDEDERDDIKPRGLSGLQNLGNTCYMNSALQALSNCPPLTRFFIDCSGYVNPEKKPYLSRSYYKLVTEMWHKKRPSYVIPSSVSHCMKIVHPMFRGYSQQDTQEFLRCFMDQLHEELKQQNIEGDMINNQHEDDHDQSSSASDYVTSGSATQSNQTTPDSNGQSESEYESCESGISSERNSVEHIQGSVENDANQQNNENDKNSSSTLTSVQEHNHINTEEDIDERGEPPMSKANKNSVNRQISVDRSPNRNLDESGDQTKTAKRNSEGSSQKPTTRLSARTKQVARGRQLSETEVLSRSVNDTDTSLVNNRQRSVSESKSNTKVNPTELDKSISNRPTPSSKAKRRIPTEFTSIISDTFDGKILSSVQCLTCERISATKETFQDLSLPIPNKDHLSMIHASKSQLGLPTGKGSCGEVNLNQGWFSWMFGWMKGWFWGPGITLQDCLAAFFSADELKGDNMYSCDKCKKLRNGVKYSRVLKLPEVLCVHLKRFRHELMFSSKISSTVKFPLDNLEMGPYLHKDCKDTVTSYDLVSVICHHGTAGGGHYTAYALNHINEQWYEFDDQYVTEVDMQQVENCEAYVLFYRKKNDTMLELRGKATLLAESPESSLLKFYISKQWLNKFNTFSEPGPITNNDFLCRHGGVHPSKWNQIGELVQDVPQKLWEFLYERYKGGPVVNNLYHCTTCQVEMENLKKRQLYEMDTFVDLHNEFQNEENPHTIYAISMAWFKEWENFVRGKTNEPPEQIDNSKICITKNGITQLRYSSDYGQLSEKLWSFLHQTYGGGPELFVKQGPEHSRQNSSSGESRMAADTKS